MQRFNGTRSIEDGPQSDRPVSVTNEENAFYFMLDIVKIRKILIQQLALNHKMSRYFIQIIAKLSRFDLYKIHLLV